MTQTSTATQTEPLRQLERFRHVRPRLDVLCWALLIFVIGGCVAKASSQNAQLPPKQERHSYVPPAGFVPTAAVATQIAQVVLVAIYGEQQVQRQLPLTAELRNNVWIVQGTLQQGSRGGVALIEIAKQDGRIIHLSHGR